MSVLESYAFIGFHCISAPLDTVRIAVREQFIQWNRVFPVVESEGKLDLARIYRGEPRSGGAHPGKAMFFDPRAAPGRTVMFANYEDAWSSLAYCVSQRVPGPVYGFRIGDSAPMRDPMYEFKVLENGKCVRVVYLMKDPRWVFWQEGAPHPAEEPERYKSLRAKNRMSREYLVAVANRLGLAIDNDAFWESDSPAVYFEEQRPDES